MNSEKRKIFLAFLFGGMGMFAVMYMFNGFPKKNITTETQKSVKTEVLKQDIQNKKGNIFEITKAETVISYVKDNHHLPDFYLTKNEAKKQGWIPSKGNLCEVLPGKAIGGDFFGNREKQLPKSEKYFEADVNYHCGNRQADRIIFTKSGEVYLTTDHYKSFQKQ
ncbi:ribonuclease domain-containing protein [Halpernia frigidisoli]|uniref:Ribonuclease n=1 Tax=Halpernia frigidisoli TaxID=1125876 RepID=A0A1I3FKT7_9FLAO|nr:ribonuclease domain-containing protein [Halpernia frigidisoli]SFI11878.1 ribonuclease [Halpernia frigidisoli]